ncbi:hypothetical protein PG995_006727 [Apiospora arundinis]
MVLTSFEFAEQWSNPTDVTTVLMIIGGDVVQKALAHTAGCVYTPVCFSFGWVSYAFLALVNVLGDGRLLPPPDYPAKVFNLQSGYARENRNWLIGRVVRDNEAYLSREKPMGANRIHISIWQARPRPNTGRGRNHHTRHPYSRAHLWGIATTILQLLVASIPLTLGTGQWGILLITAAGTVLAFVAGSLPQWTAEKLPNRQHSKQIYALTCGNGSKDIMVINGAGNCLHLDELFHQESPRGPRPWEKFSQGDDGCSSDTMRFGGSLPLHQPSTQNMISKMRFGLPIGFLITLVVCIVQTMAWLVLLISVGALDTNTWYLILVGAIGMFQNGFLAAMERSPEQRNLSLELLETISTVKVMDGLMDLEASYGYGRHLVSEFFPGPLRPDEMQWWDGNRRAYDDRRAAQMGLRSRPRSAGKTSDVRHSGYKPPPPDESERTPDSDHSTQSHKSQEELVASCSHSDGFSGFDGAPVARPKVQETTSRPGETLEDSL